MSKRDKSLKGGEVIEGGKPPELRIRDHAPRNLSDIKAIRAEMARVYRMMFDGKIFPEDATKLVFMLDKMVQAAKSEAEMSQLMNQYQDAWSGVTVTAPAGEGALLAAPVQEILPPAKQSEENENE